MPFITYNNKNVLFVHIPKTGGTSISTWMQDLAPLHLQGTRTPNSMIVSPQHLTNHDVNALFADGFFDYRFTIVRSPYDRMASEYAFRVAVAERTNRPSLPTFALWLEQVLERMKTHPVHLDNHLRPQTDFIGSGVEVFRYEDGLEAAVRRVANMIGAPTDIVMGHERVSDPDATAIEWDLQDRLRINRAFREDFDVFGYDMIKS